jgi:hypothetical protein
MFGNRAKEIVCVVCERDLKTILEAHGTDRWPALVSVAPRANPTRRVVVCAWCNRDAVAGFAQLNAAMVKQGAPPEPPAAPA